MTRALPNILTAARLVAVPLVVVFIFLDHRDHAASADSAAADGASLALAYGPWMLAALATFVAAALTDFLDGYLARRWNVISRFGILADPIADKALVLVTLATLAVFWGPALWWIVGVLAVREVGVTLGRLAVASKEAIPASKGGKLKTVLQFTAIVMMMWPAGLLDADVIHLIGFIVLVLAAIVATVTGVQYAFAIAAVRRAEPAPGPEAP